MAIATAEQITMEPMDEHNQVLLSHVHPPEWQNPAPAPLYDLIVIGAGPAGLICAAGAGGLGIGAKVALIERHLMGGDCLNVGCVPSKAIIRSAKAMGEVRDAGNYGIQIPEGARADFGAVMERMRRIRAGISHHDSTARFREEFGVDVFIGQGSFSGPNTAEVNGLTLKFRKAVIATGNRAAQLPIPGLSDVGYLTNETVFSLTELPQRLAVIGAGPIGCEMSQSFQRFGSEVTVLEVAPQILIREDRDAARIIEQALVHDGVNLVTDCKITGMDKIGEERTIHYEVDGTANEVIVDEILLSVGRQPNVEGLNLEAAGVQYDKFGVKVDDYLQTANPRVYAAGDICSRFKFTHTADAQAQIVLQNALFVPKFVPFNFGRKKVSDLLIPWCTYTDPEIAHVGMYEKDANEQGIQVDTFMQKLEEIDRAVADGDEAGFVKIHVRQGTDEILGGTIVARHAGEMLSEITTAMAAGMGLGKIAGVIHPYPTQAEAIKRCAGLYRKTLLTEKTRGRLKMLLGWS